MMGARRIGLAVGIALAALAAFPAAAQQLEPRAYSPSPVGVNFFGVVYGNASGNVVFDPSLPFTDVTANVNSVVALYVTTFGLGGRSASIAASWPYSWGHVQGNTGESFQRADRSGLGDIGFRFVCNIVGGPALTPGEFAARKPSTTLGFSFYVTAPTGQYDPAKLVNLGTNRWALKPELGLSQPFGKLWLEFYAGVTFFTTNHDFYGGHSRSQRSLTSLQAHVSYTFKPRLWLALDATWYGGGSTTVDDVANADRQSNTRLGLTLAVPVSQTHSLKFSYAHGASSRAGSKLNTFAVGWQFYWYDRRATAKAATPPPGA
jgi:hypothetical protein